MITVTISQSMVYIILRRKCSPEKITVYMIIGGFRKAGLADTFKERVYSVIIEIIYVLNHGCQEALMALIMMIFYSAFFTKPERIHLVHTLVRFIAPVFLSTQRNF